MIWAYLDRFLQWFVPSTVPFHLLRPSTCCDRFALCDGCSSPFHASGGLVDQWTGEQPTWEVKACQLQWSKRYPKGPILGVVNWANWALDPYHSISDCRCSSSAFSCYSFSRQYIRSFIFFDNMFQYLNSVFSVFTQMDYCSCSIFSAWKSHSESTMWHEHPWAPIYIDHVWALELQAYKKVNKYLKEALTEIPNESLTVQFGFLKARSSSTVRARGKGSQYEMALYRAQLLGQDKRSQWECIST